MLFTSPIDLQLAHLQGGGDNPERRRIALREMEHSFLFTLLQEMRKTMAPDLAAPESREKELYTEMLDDALSAEMARSGQFGIAKQIQEQLELRERQAAQTPVK